MLLGSPTARALRPGFALPGLPELRASTLHRTSLERADPLKPAVRSRPEGTGVRESQGRVEVPPRNRCGSDN
ncbi:hypothetical protein NDU88_003229 [Pleurodeles waltl]|uniref:Uncharacterized protein n=1 Tax=Pleurodeles waltl TaxID=8319 RepID=A0AAV7NHM2_PLEWA|nr:hypothetical protein NDU88_003229 [Pleurodeles waltl]